MDLIHSLLPTDVRDFCASHGQPAFRARQIWQWLYVQRVNDWGQMTNVPADFRGTLAQHFILCPATPGTVRADPGGTRKILMRLRDADSVETVLIPSSRGRWTVCVSTQVGCRFCCAFCASGQAGFVRDLEAGEIVGQVLAAGAELNDRPSHVVFMGMGEPLDNYDASLRAARILNDADGLAIGARRITLSTCGLVPGIQRLASEGIQFELSVSLHAPDNPLRDRLMPVNRRYPLEVLLAACREYTQQTGRIVTFEYTLIARVNDSPEQARRLAERLSAFPCRVNLIPLSAVDEYNGTSAPMEAAQGFVDVLARAGVNATLRASRGARVQAACGQLRFSRRNEGPDA